MKMLVRIATMTLVLAAILGGLFGGSTPASAANGYEQWVGGFSDGCSYYWDGSAYTGQACPRADYSGYDHYVARNGAWVYVFSWGYLEGGTMWLYSNGTYANYTTAQSSAAALDRALEVALYGFDPNSPDLTMADCYSYGLTCIGGSTSGGATVPGTDYGRCLWSLPSGDWDDDGWIESSDVSDECRSR